MRLTAETALSDRDVQEEQLLQFINREARPLMRQLRTGANSRGTERAAPVLSDGAGTYVVVWTSPEMPNDAVWTVEAEVLGVGGLYQAAYRLIQSAISVSGTCATLGTTTTVHSAESDAALDARIQVDTTNRVVTVEARDAAVTAMSWSAVVWTSEIFT